MEVGQSSEGEDEELRLSVAAEERCSERGLEVASSKAIMITGAGEVAEGEGSDGKTMINLSATVTPP